MSFRSKRWSTDTHSSTSGNSILLGNRSPGSTVPCTGQGSTISCIYKETGAANYGSTVEITNFPVAGISGLYSFSFNDILTPPSTEAADGIIIETYYSNGKKMQTSSDNNSIIKFKVDNPRPF